MSGSESRAVGRALPRKEDRRFLKGQGRYLDDVEIPGALHVCFVRSPHAHARIGGIDAEAARALPGIVAVVTGRDLSDEITTLKMAPPIEGVRPTEIAPLPVDKVRFVGDPVACVVATDRYLAEDAAELVEVDYAPLPAIASMAAAAAEGAALVDEAVPGNLVADESFTAGDADGAFRRAARVVEARFVQHRQTHLPIETRGIACLWDPGREHLTVHVGNQAPHPLRTALAARLQLAESQITVISPDVGGGFGQKIALLREELVTAALARRLGRPVRWREDRLENLLASLHAREETVTTRAAVDEGGRLLALRARIEADMGAYCFFPANYMMRVVGMILPGPYRLRDYAYDLRVHLTNKCPAGPMRAPMAITSWVMEGTIDAIARALDLDPVEVRRRNLLQNADLPYVTATGERYHSISPAATMGAALRALDYVNFRARQAERRAAGRLVGLGICNVVESTTYGSAFYKAAGIPGSGHETATVRVEPSGACSVAVGLMTSGQGYETTFAQAAAEGLGVNPEQMRVLIGDTDVAPYGMGARGSRGAAAGGGVAYLAGERLQEKVLAIAAGLLNLNSSDGLRLVDGEVRRLVGGAFEPTGLTLADIARVAFLDPLRLPAGMEPGLHVTVSYDPPPMTYSNSTHLCAVEVDGATGMVNIERYVVAHDSGTVINPLVVEGQMHGAVAMGLSGALFEELVYDAEGQMLSGSLADYLMATATELPAFEIIEHATRDTHTPLGIKGMAEGGVMGAIGAVCNAVADALAPLGIRVDSQPLTPARLTRLLVAAEQMGR